MSRAAVDAHRAVAVIGDLRAELTAQFGADAWPNLSLHAFPSGSAALRADLRETLCLWFVPEVLTDMTGISFIELLGDLRSADRFVLITREYDEDVDRRAACLGRTTYSVWPLAPPVLRGLLDSFLSIGPAD